ncbi:hypothetical protein GCM10010421_28160 [Streptomyces glaucus]|uniref:Secreted protein n=1 Tax=Streptomyces glaucus TaxID=284029 RepID=A0ABN3JPN0_9ACTN
MPHPCHTRATTRYQVWSPISQGVSDGSRDTAPPIDVPDEALVAPALGPTRPLPNCTVRSPHPSGSPTGPRGGFPL